MISAFTLRLRQTISINLTVGDGANTLRCFPLPRARITFGFGQTFGLHPFVGLLRDFLP
jgi:hypothetical protein